jgi:uridylate kinase
MEPKYHRVLIKLSGEALAGEEGFGINPTVVEEICREIKKIALQGVEIAIVVGGGNFWRGRYAENMDKSSADYMGMLATVINAMALQDVLERLDLPTRVQSAIEMKTVCEPYIKRKAIRHLEKGRIVVFAAGTGNPFFTTDTAASLRAVEIDADIILLAKNVDAVYSADPVTHPDAVRYDSLTYQEVMDRQLKVMDLTAITLCRENHMPVQVFGLNDPKNLVKAVDGEHIGTLID